MRKLFSILAVAMTAISLHATVVTKEYDLADLTKQQQSTTWSANELTVTKGWDGIAHDYGEYPYNAEDYTELTLELASTSEVGVNLTIKYSDNSTLDKTINAGSLIARIPLSSSSIKRIDIRLTAAGSATISKLYFSKVIGKETVTNLFTGSNTFDWNWEHHRILIPNTEFTSIHEGDRIQFTYTSGASGQCQVRVQESNAELAETGEYAAITQNQAEPATFSFVLRAEDMEKVMQNGLYFHGNDYTITSIDLYTYEQQFMEEIILNTGEEVLDWNNQHWVHTSGLPTLAAGDELRITVSAVVSGQYWQVNFRHNDNGDDAITFGSNDETTPKVYSFSLTAEQASNINTAGKLLVVGTNVTLSRFTIAQPRGIYSTLYHGEKAMEWTGLFYEASQFSELTVGDRICANVSEIGDRGNYPKLIFSANYTEFTPSAQYDFSASHAAPMTVSYPVTAEMLSLIQANGLRLRGEYCTLTEVYVQSAEPATVSYNLKVSSAGMATLVLPFNVSTLPAGVEAYTLVNNGDATIWANQVSSIEADKPVLIVAAQNEDPGYEFVSEYGGNKDISGKAGAYRNGALVGTYQRIDHLYGDDGEGGNYHYILQKHDEKVAFYKVGAAECSIAPYRAYLSCGYPGTGPSAPMRIVFHKDAPTGVESVQHSAISTQKILRNGQILIIRDNKIVNVLGQQL